MIVEGDGPTASAYNSDNEESEENAIVLGDESPMDDYEDASDNEAGASSPLLGKSRRGSPYKATSAANN